MPRQAAQDLAVYNDDTDSAMYAAYRQRTANPNDQLTQDLLGPKEHQQFMEETTARNPVQGTSVGLFSSGYSVAKRLAEAESRSNRPSAIGMASQALVNTVGTGEAKTSRASVDELFAAGTGYVKGLKKFFKGK